MSNPNERSVPTARSEGVRSFEDNPVVFELEPFVFGLLNFNWGKTVWEIVAEEKTGSGVATPSTERGNGTGGFATSLSKNTVWDFGNRIVRLFQTCTDPGIMPSENERDASARTHAWTPLCTSLSPSTETRSATSAESRRLATRRVGPYLRRSFAARWTCMSLVSVRKMLSAQVVRTAAQRVVTRLAEVYGGDEDEVAAQTTDVIDRHLKGGWEAADILHSGLNLEGPEGGALATRGFRSATDEVDQAMTDFVQTMVRTTGGVLGHLPTAALSWASDSPDDDRMRSVPPHLILQFIPPQLFVHRLWLCVWALQNIATEDWSSNLHRPKDWGELCAREMGVPELTMDHTPAPIKAQLLRLQDLRDGGYMFALELFMAAVRATLFLLLQQIFPRCNNTPDEAPMYIVDDFLTFLGNVLVGKNGPTSRDVTVIIFDILFLHARRVNVVNSLKELATNWSHCWRALSQSLTVIAVSCVAWKVWGYHT
ncbi:hypothetical protein EDB89DRAFT_2240375, partial [Lactarius sanguifluus]